LGKDTDVEKNQILIDLNHFKEACKVLNEINKNIPTWETEFSEIKENFVNRCKDIRIKLTKKKNDIMNDLATQEKDNINPILYAQAHKKIEEIYNRMKECDNDNRHTYDALCQLEEEPALIDNIDEVQQMVENEYKIWKSYNDIIELYKRIQDETWENKSKTEDIDLLSK